MPDPIAGRLYGASYRVHRRSDLHECLVAAVESAGAKVLYASGSDRAPVFIGAELGSGERMGMLVYLFRVKQVTTRNRPVDEVRGQLRYGSESTWLGVHPLARDEAGVDTTMVIGADVQHGIFLGLDAVAWDPLPMGISFYAKVADLAAAGRDSWHVWEKVNRSGTRRSAPRTPTCLETVVAFTPDRLIDYARLERHANALRLDPALRFALARNMADHPGAPSGPRLLEQQFGLTGDEILDIIGGRHRLAVAVRGGVAEFHLERLLAQTSDVVRVERLDVDAMHDFNVTLRTGEIVRVECKNASPQPYADGDFKVEVQKTRASKGDPASRFYRFDAFDVVAACLFSATGSWHFRFARTAALARHDDFPERMAAIQRITPRWSDELFALSTMRQ